MTSPCRRIVVPTTFAFITSSSFGRGIPIFCGQILWCQNGVNVKETATTTSSSLLPSSSSSSLTTLVEWKKDQEKMSQQKTCSSVGFLLANDRAIPLLFWSTSKESTPYLIYWVLFKPTKQKEGASIFTIAYLFDAKNVENTILRFSE